MSKQSILFFTPYLGQNGAEYALVNLLSASKLGETYNVVLVSGYKGELYNLAPESVRVYCINEIQQELKWKIKNKLSTSDVRDDIILGIQKKYNPIFWFINTSVQPHYLQLAMRLKMPVMLYVHELEQRLQRMDASYVSNLRYYPHSILLSSNVVRNEWQDNTDNSKLNVLWPAIDYEISGISDSALIRKQLNIGLEKRLVIGVGNFDENKNPKLFAETARALSHNDEFVFVWVGGDLNTEYAKEIVGQYGTPGTPGAIQFSGWMDRSDYLNLLNASDFMLCTSTFESFGVSLMEGAYLGKPVITTKCGGPEFTVKKGMGLIVENATPPNLANALLSINDGRTEFDANQAKSNSLEYAVENVSSKFKTLIDEMIINLRNLNNN